MNLKKYFSFRKDNIHAWILLLTFLVSFGYALLYRIPPISDARGYHGIAISLVEKGTYCLDCDTVSLQNDRAIFWVGPGYQFFLAGFFKIFGTHLWIIWLVQALMHTAVVAMLWALIRRAIPVAEPFPWWYRLPLVLYAFHPDIVQLQGMLMTESLFLFLLVGSVYLADRVIRDRIHHAGSLRRHWATTAMLGIVLGMLFMVRQTGAGALLLVLAFLFWRKFWKEAAVVLLLALSLQVPWTIRNYHVYHRFILNTVVGGVDMWVGLHPQGTGEFSIIPEVQQKIEGLTADEREYVSMQEVKKLIVADPGHAVLRTIQKGFKLFSLAKTSGFWFHYFSRWDQLLTLGGSILFNLALLSMGFASLWETIRTRRVSDWLVLCLSLLIFLMAAAPILTVVINRYRIPVIPSMVILATDWLVHTRKKERWLSLAGACAFLVVATGVDVWGSMPKLAEHIQRIRNK